MIVVGIIVIYLALSVFTFWFVPKFFMRVCNMDKSEYIDMSDGTELFIAILFAFLSPMVLPIVLLWYGLSGLYIGGWYKRFMEKTL